MEWNDQGFLLTRRRHGETSAIVELFTEHHGRHAGVVRGGASRRMVAPLQPGNQLQATWRARLPEHLGHFTVEALDMRGCDLMADRLALSGLNAIVALLRLALPERAAHPRLYAASITMLDTMRSAICTSGAGWSGLYLEWEMVLLDEMGFGLDLSSCAVTGATDDLAHVSPRSGRAVSTAGAGRWAGRLLPYPDPANALAGLRTTGHFLARALGDRPLPDARARLIAALGRAA